MPKLLSALLIFFYMLPAVGFSVDVHWCGKKVKLIAFDSPHEKKCPCSKKMPAGCCKDIHVSAKLTDNQKAASQLTAPNNCSKQLNSVVSLLVSKPVSHVIVFDFTRYHAPPFKNKLPVYLANHIFRI